jgi:hypothetical protein
VAGLRDSFESVPMTFYAIYCLVCELIEGSRIDDYSVCQVCVEIQQAPKLCRKQNQPTTALPCILSDVGFTLFFIFFIFLALGKPYGQLHMFIDRSLLSAMAEAVCL